MKPRFKMLPVTDAQKVWKTINWRALVGNIYTALTGRLCLIAEQDGTFDTPREAHAAYVVAAQHYFGEFARAA